MTFWFWSTVHCIVLGRGDDFEVTGVVSLQSFHKRYAHARGQIGIFAIGFLAASPPWIAKDIDVGTPKGETFVSAALALADKFVVLGACFRGDNISDLEHQIGIPGSRETNGLRKDSGITGSCDSVQCFVPPLVLRNTQALNRSRAIHHLRDLFLEGHARDEIVNSLFDRQ